MHHIKHIWLFSLLIPGVICYLTLLGYIYVCISIISSLNGMSSLMHCIIFIPIQLRTNANG
uniref:Uncharacterized protein n=1 Tax=Nelumbo nucifera TaxID=4432 RepID=A0A822ZG25_NELNU|nr:TPA_asm: hypothetical protein HUJ06_013294 [Nelumbo nucifera]